MWLSWMWVLAFNREGEVSSSKETEAKPYCDPNALTKMERESAEHEEGVMELGEEAEDHEEGQKKLGEGVMELGEEVEDLEEEPKELGEEGEDLELGEGEQEVEDKAEEVGDGATNVGHVAKELEGKVSKGEMVVDNVAKSSKMVGQVSPRPLEPSYQAIY